MATPTLAATQGINKSGSCLGLGSASLGAKSGPLTKDCLDQLLRLSEALGAAQQGLESKLLALRAGQAAEEEAAALAEAPLRASASPRRSGSASSMGAIPTPGCCPEGHKLTTFASRGGACSRCGTEVSCGVLVRDCRRCKWWVCGVCAPICKSWHALDMECPKGHSLQPDRTTHGGACDRCTTERPANTFVMDCSECHWWLCDKCVQAELPPSFAGEPPPPLVLEDPGAAALPHSPPALPSALAPLGSKQSAEVPKDRKVTMGRHSVESSLSVVTEVLSHTPSVASDVHSEGQKKSGWSASRRGLASLGIIDAEATPRFREMVTKGGFRRTFKVSVLRGRLSEITPAHVKDAVACPTLQYWAERLEAMSSFEFVSFIMIVVNTVSLTWAAERAALGMAPLPLTTWADDACFTFYCLELLIRVMAHRLRFFYNVHSSWNWFDLILILLDALTKMLHGGIDVSYMRVLRVLKVLKLLRVIRMLRFFKELRLILGAMTSSLKSIMWAMIMVFVITFIFSICFVQALADENLTHTLDIGPNRSTGPLHPGWDGVVGGMVALFMAGTGGLDWHALYEPLVVLGSVYPFFFIFYIVLFFFVVQNTVTSLFVECLLDKQSNDEALIVHERLEQKHVYIAKIQALFEYLDSDGDGLLSYEDLMRGLDDPRMVSFAHNLDMDESDLKMFFNILTASGKHYVDVDGFVTGCIKLRGNAKSIDVVDLMLQISRLCMNHENEMEEANNFRRQCLHEVQKVNKAFARAPTSSTLVPASDTTSQYGEGSVASSWGKTSTSVYNRTSMDHHSMDRTSMDRASMEESSARGTPRTTPSSFPSQKVSM